MYRLTGESEKEMANVLKNSKGEKLYPVCGFQRSQHKLYYWETKAWLKCHDDEYTATEKDWEELEFWQEVLEYATCIYDGLIYMPWKYYNRVKEAIAVYDMNH